LRFAKFDEFCDNSRVKLRFLLLFSGVKREKKIKTSKDSLLYDQPTIVSKTVEKMQKYNKDIAKTTMSQLTMTQVF